MKILSTSDLNGDRNKYFDLMGVVKRHTPDYVILSGNIYHQKQNCILSDYHYIHENYDLINEISKISKILISFGGTSDLITSNLFSNYIKNDRISNVTNSILSLDDCVFVFDNSIRPNDIIKSDWIKNDSEYNEENIDSLNDSLKRIVKNIDIAKSLWFTYSNPSSIYPIQYSIDKFPFHLYHDQRFSYDSYCYRNLIEGVYTDKIQPISFVSSYVDSNHETYKKCMKKIGSCFCFRNGQYNSNFLNYVLMTVVGNKLTSWYHPMEQYNQI